MAPDAITRRSLLRSGAGGAALIASSGLPAWAKPIADASRLRRPDSRPFPHLRAGTPSMHQIKHVVVLMLENHSFDNLLGMVPHQVPGRRGVDGLKLRGGKPVQFNRDAQGNTVFANHASSPCQLHGKPTQAWNASHLSYDAGRNDGFVRAGGPSAMWYWDRSDLPTLYSLARYFPIGERFFSSVLAQTYPNRRFFLTGTASGTISTNSTTFSVPAANGTILDRFDAHGISYAAYYQDLPSWLIVPNILKNQAQNKHQHKMPQFFTDVAAGRLRQFTFLDPNYETTSEEDPQDIQVGEQFVSQVVHALMHAPTWKNTVLFITYDEHGGYYDHVAPPRAIKPDNVPPLLMPGDVVAGYDRYGFRVPLLVISPWAKPNYVSRRVQDHTSITAFIERKWNLPAMTFRDANADPMTDYFDLGHATFAKPPKIVAAPPLAPGLAKCHAAGLNPPLPTSGGAAAPSDVARYLQRVSH